MSEARTPIRYRCFGARHSLGQLPRIEQGLLGLGAVEAPDGDPNVDLVYANDEPRWQEAIDYRDRVAPKAKLILTVLDIPEHNPNCDIYALRPRLIKADAVTVISPFVQSQVQRLLGMNGELIWNPIKDITPSIRHSAAPKPYPYKVLMAGRLRDPGKRAELAIRSLIRAGFEEREVAIVGGEWPSWGTDLGMVSDEVLNSLYNSVDFVLVCSSFEGLGLPICEAMAGGALPIVTMDLTTFADLGMPRRWGCYPSVYSIAHRLIILSNNRSVYEEERAIAEQIGQQMIKELSGAAVASRLLDTYSRIANTTTP